ncbi:hypothetical protein QQ008_07725 [Fulvivirgaceae bacterium BMA10]|uniref:Uncharacterized protein n=1 Tax=Splendidivirga corallicola TaxID=3051826 RepID=A0ABT8KKK1_9BACT|nr:hypothetical protein [Fulvivirgaceae bacterium BMA10]
MSNKELIKAGCVVGGLVGLGILVYIILKEDDEKVEKALNEPGGHQERSRRPTGNKRSTVMKGKRDSELQDAEHHHHNNVLDPLEEINEHVKQLDERVAEEEKINRLPPPEADEFPLRLGSNGEKVERLQVWLMRNYGLFGKITKIYDEKTEALVKKHLGVDMIDEKIYNRYKMSKHVTEQVIVR